MFSRALGIDLDAARDGATMQPTGIAARPPYMRSPDFDSAIYDPGIMPGLLAGHFAIVASSIFRCWATNAGGVCVSQLDKEISS